MNELFGMPCIRYVYVTQRKDPEEELLRVLLGASISVPNKKDIGAR